MNQLDRIIEVPSTSLRARALALVRVHARSLSFYRILSASAPSFLSVSLY